MTQITATLVDSMGTDLTIVNSARVSFGKKVDTFDIEKDSRLIRYLAKHKHFSPFNHAFASFHVKAPVFVARQLVKHEYLVWNEISRRYVASDPEFYNPVLREATKDKKQGSGCEMGLPKLDGIIKQSNDDASQRYKYLLSMGVCEEQARVVLPLNHMSEWYWSGSLGAFAKMCNLRCTGDTQGETRIVADQIDHIMLNLFPIAWDALTNEDE